jgi:hypothetical protein
MVTRSQAARAFLWARSRRYFLRVQRTKVGVDARQEHGQRGAVERAVVLHPSADDRVDHFGELGAAQLGAPVQLPPAHGAAEPFQGLLADRREERGEHVPPRTTGCAGPERVPQEREGRVLPGATPAAVLAVHDPGLVGMQPQPDLGHPVPDRPAGVLRLASADAVHHAVVGVAFERYRREDPAHPRVERVMQKQVRQHGRDRRALWGTAVSLLQGAVRMLHGGGKPPLDAMKERGLRSP